MTSDFDPSLFDINLFSCGERIGSLKYSVEKTVGLFPMELDDFEHLTEDQKESIDAMILRYSQCVSRKRNGVVNCAGDTP